MKTNPRVRYRRPVPRGFSATVALFFALMLVLDFTRPPGGPWVTALFVAVDTAFLVYYGRQFLLHKALTDRADNARALRARYGTRKEV